MLEIGDQVFLTGGYEMIPSWLDGQKGYTSIVMGFVDSDFGILAIMKLEKIIKSDNLESDVILTRLRYENSVWRDEGVVHLYLCLEMPMETYTSKDWYLQKTVWIESHATYKKI